MSDHQTGFDHVDFGRPGEDSPFVDVEFTISNGQVSDVERVVGSRTVDLGLPARASFSVGSGTVTETLAHGSTTDTLTYTADASKPSLYHLSQEQQTFDTSASNAPTYGFTIANGTVTAMSESLGASGRTHNIDLSKLPATAFTASGSSVTETAVHGNTVETLLFTTSDGSAYKLASDTESFVSAGTATTKLDVEPGERMSFTFSGDTVTAAQLVKPDGTTVALSSHMDVSYSEPAAGYVVETVSQGSHSYYEVFHDGNGDGIYTAVAHGTGSTVDLVGLQAQITPLINTLL